MRLADPAVKTGAAIELRVDDHAVAGSQRAASRVRDLADLIVFV
jgi:hypothetical protein